MSKNLKSIDFDDDYEDYENFSKHMDDDTERNKKKFARILGSQSEMLLAEIEQKKESQKHLRKKYVRYILKHEKNRYSENSLNSLSFEDVVSIYEDVKLNRNVFSKIFDFFFGG
jgi:hypothetical protein